MATERHDYAPGDVAADDSRPCGACGERRLATVRLPEQAIAHMLALPEGLRVIGVRDDFLSMSIMVMIEGEQLAPVVEATVPPMLQGEWQLIEPADFTDDTPARIRWVPPNYQTG